MIILQVTSLVKRLLPVLVQHQLPLSALMPSREPSFSNLFHLSVIYTFKLISFVNQTSEVCRSPSLLISHTAHFCAYCIIIDVFLTVYNVSPQPISPCVKIENSFLSYCILNSNGIIIIMFHYNNYYYMDNFITTTYGIISLLHAIKTVGDCIHIRFTNYSNLTFLYKSSVGNKGK